MGVHNTVAADFCERIYSYRLSLKSCRRSQNPLNSIVIPLSESSLCEKVRASLEPRRQNKAFSLSKLISVAILQTFCVPMSFESLNVT